MLLVSYTDYKSEDRETQLTDKQGLPFENT